MKGFTVRVAIGIALAVRCGHLYASDASNNSYIRLPISEAHDILFVPMSFGQGPSHGRVSQIIEGPIGFLWFGTRDGLKRYDGYRFRDFRADPANPKAMAGVSVNALLADHSRRLWVASDEYLDRYDPSTEAFVHFPPQPGKLEPPVNDIYQGRDGIIWFATSHGLTRLDPVSGEIQRFQHNPNDPSSLTNDFLRSTFEEKEGTLWVAGNAALDLFDRRTARVVEHYSLSNPLRAGATATANPSVHLFQDRTGVLWIASSRDGLAKVEREGRKLIFIALDPRADPRFQPGANTIFEDQAGNLWVGTNGGGLLKLNRDRTSLARYRNQSSDPDSLSSDTVLALLGDHEGGIWVGTGGGGVLRIPIQTVPFVRYRHRAGDANSLPSDYVSSVFEDSKHNIWVGSYGEVTRIDRQTGTYSRHKIESEADAEITAIAEDRSGHLWFGTRGRGLSRFDPRTGRLKVYRHDPLKSASLSHDAVFALLVDRLGRIWVGTEDGLNRFNEETDDFRVYKAPGVNPNRERAIAEDAAGVLWLGTWYSGLHRFDPATGQFTLYRSSNSPGTLSNDAVAAVAVDRSGMIWAGTENGLDRLDPSTGKITAYDTRDGLPNNNVNGIVEDSSGDLWITTSNGVADFDRRQNVFRNYYRSDGVLGDFTCAWRSPAGELFFGAITGLTTLLPVRTDARAYVPPVVLTEFQVLDKNAPIGDKSSPLKQALFFTKSLSLSHRQNTFSIEFAALSFSSPQRTRYRYRLEPLEKEWNEVDSTQRVARYTTVPAGEYAFRVQCRAAQSGWAESEAGLRIQVLPPWWATLPFEIACALAFALFLWMAHRVRVRQVADRLNLRMEERLSERTRIARDLHDTMLQSFQAALLKFHAVAFLLPDHTEGKKMLEAAIEQARDAVNEGRDTVQGLRSSTLVANDLRQAISAVGEGLARDQAGENGPEFGVNVEGESRDLPPIVRDEVYRIASEALRNAFKHAGARRIEAEIHYDKREFRLRVRDDGKGIDPKVLDAGGRAGHHGLPGMRERAKLVGGRLAVRSQVDSGTEIDLIISAELAYAKSPAGSQSASAEKVI